MQRSGCVLAAAGSGQRFGSDIPKQFVSLVGKPIWVRAVAPFIGIVDTIVIVAHPDFHDLVRQQSTQANLSNDIEIIAGGATRTASVYAGLKHLADNHNCDVGLIHDAARPFIDQATIRHCLQALDDHPACVVAGGCIDTPKQIHAASGLVSSTINRDQLRLAQTPQGLRLAQTLDHYAKAVTATPPLTDDVQVAEHAGLPVAVVPGPRWNFKITLGEDLALAKALIAINE